MKKGILIISIAIVALGILSGVLAFILYEPAKAYNSEKDISSLGAQSLDGKVSRQELANHTSQSDCWVGYKGKVYDVSSFLPNHPGGINAIASRCGTAEEFENAFTKKHGTSKSDLFMKVSIYKGDLVNA